MRKNVKSVMALMTTLVVLTAMGEAKESPRVYVHEVVRVKSLSGAKLLSNRFESTALKSLEKSSQLKLVRLDAPADSQQTEMDTTSTFLNKLIKGKALYSAKKYLEATEILKSAIKDFEDEAKLGDTLLSYLQALEYLGASYQMLDYGGDAKDVFRQRAAIAPERDMSRDFQAKVLQKYEKTKKKWLKKKKGVIAVQAKDSELQFRFDTGELFPASAASSVDAHRGRHRVGCGRAETDMQYRWVTVKSKETVTIDCDTLAGPAKERVNPKALMNDFVTTLKRSPNDVDTAAQGRKLCAKLGIDYVAIPFMRQSGEKLEVIGVIFAARGGVTAQIGSYGFGRQPSQSATQARLFARGIESSVQSFPYQNALAAGFLRKPSSRLVDRPLSPGASRMLSKTESPKLKKKWYKTWWFWTSTVVVAGGLSAAGYYMVTGEQEQGKFDLEVSW